MAGLGDALASTGMKMPVFSSGGIFQFILAAILFILIIGGLGGFAWWFILKKIYNRRIVIFEKVGQIFEPTGYDTAKEYIIGDGGEKVLYLRKRKFWKVAEKQSSRSTYWFAVLDDGYWYNITLGDLNSKLGTVEATGISPEIHKLMRYQNAGLRKNLQERHLKKNWYDHPLIGWIGAIVFVLIAGIMLYLIAKQMLQDLPQTLALQNSILERQFSLLEIMKELTLSQKDTTEMLINSGCGVK